MKLVIAGGCGEHGRNCFWVKKGRHTWIVDCGLAETDTDCYPKLSKKKIREAKYLFFTHSHKDHAGAIPWLIEMGFAGEIVASGNTFQQIPFAVDRKLILEEICPKGKGKLGGLHIKWGRSGHCLGSVWYQFRAGRKRILFSGDYTEHTKVYRTDRLREKKLTWRCWTVHTERRFQDTEGGRNYCSYCGKNSRIAVFTGTVISSDSLKSRKRMRNGIVRDNRSFMMCSCTPTGLEKVLCS